MKEFLSTDYRGRLAPSPTGLLHLGHARTFWTACERARRAGGALILRNEDLDQQRSKSEFVEAFIEDLNWLGCKWSEGPDIGGDHAPYNQSERTRLYRDTLEQLIETGNVYACTCSRKDIQSSVGAPQGADDELIYPGTCRINTCVGKPSDAAALNASAWGLGEGTQFSLRMRVPDGREIYFNDRGLGERTFVANRDFGDFVLWRHDDVPSYQIAVVTDDIAMQITEVVRGADLLVSTARQLLIYEILGVGAPMFCHCPLVCDEEGERLSKRSDDVSLSALRESGKTAREVRSMWESEL